MISVGSLPQCNCADFFAILIHGYDIKAELALRLLHLVKVCSLFYSDDDVHVEHALGAIDNLFRNEDERDCY